MSTQDVFRDSIGARSPDIVSAKSTLHSNCIYTHMMQEKMQKYISDCGYTSIVWVKRESLWGLGRKLYSLE